MSSDSIVSAAEQEVSNLEMQKPHVVVLYDHLVLSLRETDLIATFNWDPLLVQAYIRNSKMGLKLPKLLFLHGNISIGYCKKHEMTGLINERCKKCSEIYQPSQLLYPIKKKNYANDQFISNQWKSFKSYFKSAFMITIFGYSGPKTDEEAITAMKEAWGDVNHRNLEQPAFISLQSDQEISENWEQFIYSDHWDLSVNFYDSWIANHPRRTGEAYLNQYINIKYIDDNPIPRDLDFPDLWSWYKRFQQAEEAFLKKAEDEFFQEETGS